MQMDLRKLLTAIAILLPWASHCCAQAEQGNQPVLHRYSGELLKQAGVWRSRGNGWWWVIKDGRVTIYDAGAGYCSRRWQRWGLPRHAGSGMLMSANGRTIRLTLGDRTYFHTFDKVSSLPRACRDKSELGPRPNFEAMAAILSEHYAFFEQRGVDWSKHLQARRLRIHDHLTEQLHMSTRDEVKLLIGAHLIDLIDDGGYLREEVVDIAVRLGANEGTVETALKLVQTFEPSGVGARTLQECLRLQLKDKGELTPNMDLFLEHIHYLGTHNLPALRRACRFSEEDLKTHIEAIRELNPKPGLQYGRDLVQTVIPDVHVTESADGGWKVELNADTLPKVIANERYFAKLSASSETEKQDTKSFLNEQMSNANWLVKSLDQRARTILKVSTEIVKFQDEFFVKGIAYLRPLNLKTIADAIEMHESTVSRVTSNKYIHTPRGTFELKYFFTPAIAARARWT